MGIEADRKQVEEKIVLYLAGNMLTASTTFVKVADAGETGFPYRCVLNALMSMAVV
jgi:hypothetical protein